MSEFNYANLAFLTNYTDGSKNDEIESEIYRIAFQIKESTHYARKSGGSFQYIEQESQNAGNEVLMLRFASNLIESIYMVNEARNFDPYIVVGFSDISTKIKNSSFLVDIKYRLLKDLTRQGIVNIQM